MGLLTGARSCSSALRGTPSTTRSCSPRTPAHAGPALGSPSLDATIRVASYSACSLPLLRYDGGATTLHLSRSTPPARYHLRAICLPVTLTRHAPGVQYLPAWGHRPLKMTGRTGASICCIKFCEKCGKLVKLQVYVGNCTLLFLRARTRICKDASARARAVYNPDRDCCSLAPAARRPCHGPLQDRRWATQAGAGGPVRPVAPHSGCPMMTSSPAQRCTGGARARADI